MKVESFEREALSLLCSELISNSVLHSAITHPESVKCKFTGAGYFLEIQHSDLPIDRTVCDRPIVVGFYQEQEVGFIAFVENGAICLECYSYGNKGIPEEIRNGSVRISAT